MNLERLAYIAIVKNHLAGLVANVSVVTRDKKRQADAKITELDKMFLDEVLGLNPILPQDEKLIYLSPADKRLMNGVEAAQAILNDLVKNVVTEKEVGQIVESQIFEGKEDYKQLKADVKNAEMTDEEAEQYAKDLEKEKEKLRKAGKTNKKTTAVSEKAIKRAKEARKTAFLKENAERFLYDSTEAMTNKAADFDEEEKEHLLKAVEDAKNSVKEKNKDKKKKTLLNKVDEAERVGQSVEKLIKEAKEDKEALEYFDKQIPTELEEG